MAQWGHDKNDARGGAWCSQACRPLTDADHRWKRDELKGPMPDLIPYDTPRPAPPSRGNWQGLAPMEQVMTSFPKLRMRLMHLNQ
jgi:hypothetical protein